MKKNCLWILFLILLLIVGVLFFYQQTPPTPLLFILPEDAIAFSGEFSSAGVGPAENYTATPSEDDLVIGRNNVDSSDHLFVPATLYTSFIAPQDLKEGTLLYFSGWVQWLEGAAGSHYYAVVGVDELKKTGTEVNPGGPMIPYA
ncbi:hypothetical protein FACS1894176_00980 [Bacteroidia bacterium]|nr:hypothetical protein FACS1894176_00980 [Bacteroidia bacterium]